MPASVSKKEEDKINIKEQIKKMYQFATHYGKTNVLFFTFLITSVINELMLRHFTLKNTFDISPFLADLAFLLIIFKTKTSI